LEPEANFGGRSTTYRLALTQLLSGDATVNVNALALLTPQYPNDKGQVQVSVTPSIIHFDATNSNTWVSVTVAALNDTGGRHDYQSYPYKLRRPDVLKGPLYISGGVDSTVDVSSPNAIMLPGEKDLERFNLTASSCYFGNFFADEDKQMDTVVIHNENSFLNADATLDGDVLLGLGMCGPLAVGINYFRGGVTFDDIETITVIFGSGDDSFLLHDVSASRVVLSMADGNDNVTVLQALHSVAIDLGSGDSHVLLGTTHSPQQNVMAGDVTQFNAPITVWGHPTNDDGTIVYNHYVTIDDSNTTMASDWLIDHNVVTSSRMVTSPSINAVHYLRIQAVGGTFALGFSNSSSSPTIGDIPFDAPPSLIARALQIIMFDNPYKDKYSCGKAQPGMLTIHSNYATVLTPPYLTSCYVVLC
jgi:hypothetical protein